MVRASGWTSRALRRRRGLRPLGETPSAQRSWKQTRALIASGEAERVLDEQDLLPGTETQGVGLEERTNDVDK